MKKLGLVLTVTLFSLLSVSAQTVPSICGMTTADQAPVADRLLANRQADIAVERGAVQYVPIHFHFVGNVSGEGKVRAARVLEQLCRVNQQFEAVNIRFYLSPHPTYGMFNTTINNDNVYNNQSNTLLMNSRRHKNAVNVYLVQTPASNNNNPGTVLAYYSPGNDWVVSRISEINGNENNNTVSHELGHFLSLPHTFYGWESDPFSSDDTAWPVAPANSPGGIATELMDGSNCTKAGDNICDTPPDYNLGLFWNGCSNYAGGAKDTKGVLVNPMENNFMGYFDNCTTYAWTQGQIDAMIKDLNSTSRNNLDNTFVPAAETIETPTDLLISPAANATVNYYDEVLLQWKSVKGATHYLLETDITPNYNSVSAQFFIITDTSYMVLNFDASRSYYWRVTPFNQYVTCAAGRQRTLKTSAVSGLPEISNLSAWTVAPNPTTAGTPAQLIAAASESFEANLSVVNAAGRSMYRRNAVFFPAGQSTVEVPATDWPAGFYIVTLENENGRSVRKLVIQK